jgi:hypothetical protein
VITVAEGEEAVSLSEERNFSRAESFDGCNDASDGISAQEDPTEKVNNKRCFARNSPFQDAGNQFDKSDNLFGFKAGRNDEFNQFDIRPHKKSVFIRKNPFDEYVENEKKPEKVLTKEHPQSQPCDVSVDTTDKMNAIAISSERANPSLKTRCLALLAYCVAVLISFCFPLTSSMTLWVNGA